jgi:hypothetical protein
LVAISQRKEISLSCLKQLKNVLLNFKDFGEEKYYILHIHNLKFISVRRNASATHPTDPSMRTQAATVCGG